VLSVLLTTRPLGPIPFFLLQIIFGDLLPFLLASSTHP
jgi:hypothetical protein